MASALLQPNELLELSDSLSASGLNDYEDQFLEIFEKIGREERELVTKLIRRFEVCRLDKYLSLSEDLTQSVFEKVKEASRVICLPLSDPAEASSPKSGSAVLWIVRRDIEKRRLSNGLKLEVLPSLNATDLSLAELSVNFVLFDDFIGSGDTAVKSVDKLVKKGIPANKIIVAAYVGLSSGRKAISDFGAEPVFLKTLPKGITESNEILDKGSALAVMERLEANNGVPGKFRFGYEASEALALMCFCPNNTFPFFWWNGNLWQGPLQR